MWRKPKKIKITLYEYEAEILLIQLEELDARTTTVNRIVKYLREKLGK